MGGWRGVLACAAIVLGGAAPACASDPNALWTIVGLRCVPDERDHGKPDPCAAVDLAGGDAVLKDIRGHTQYLLIPTVRVGGIEDPAILAPGAPNYWADAWAARSFVEQQAGRTLPRDAIALAINSVYGRSQNQFHIHIDCIDPQVRDTLLARQGTIGEAWAPLGAPLAGHDYLARRLIAATPVPNPFLLLADGVPGARADMGAQTLVVAGASFPQGDGFVLLADRADPAAGNHGSGEELQDHSCALARTLPLAPAAALPAQAPAAH